LLNAWDTSDCSKLERESIGALPQPPPAAHHLAGWLPRVALLLAHWDGDE